MKVNVLESREVEAKTISLTAKCSDLCSITLLAKDGTVIKEHDGYVPNFMPGEHWGDYIILNIDLETGKILNWKVPTSAAMQEFIDEGRK